MRSWTPSISLVKICLPFLLAALHPLPGAARQASDGEPLFIAQREETRLSDSLTVLFWNLENFFDWKDGGASESDREFSSGGEKHWTYKRFRAKCERIAKAVLMIAERSGSPPDVIAVAEVENALVLRRLLSETLLRKLDYGIVHFDSPDPRGIDVALLFRRCRVDTVRCFPVRIPGVVTRDMLAVQLRLKAGGAAGRSGAGGMALDGAGDMVLGGPAESDIGDIPGCDSLAIIVCHHPSKYSGAASEPRRRAAVARLCEVSDSLAARGWGAQMAIGDFNDMPDSPTYLPLGEPRFVNLSAGPAAKGEGSIRFNGRWQLIDQCFLSPPLAAGARFTVCHVPFLTARDSAHGGEKPLRTYVGPRYTAGVSDHRPILVTVIP